MIDKMMLTHENNLSRPLLDEIKHKNEALFFWFEYVKYKYGVLDQEEFGNDLHEIMEVPIAYLHEEDKGQVDFFCTIIPPCEEEEGI